jgi:K+-transporting ATPase A subunit
MKKQDPIGLASFICAGRGLRKKNGNEKSNFYNDYRGIIRSICVPFFLCSILF